MFRFFKFSCVFSISVLSNTNVYLLIQNKKLLALTLSLARQLFNICVNRRRLCGLSFFFSLALMCFNRLNYCFYNSLCVFLSLFLSKWCCRRIVCLHLAYRKVRNNILKRIIFCDIFLTKSEFVVFFMMCLYGVGAQRSVASDYSCRATKIDEHVL